MRIQETIQLGRAPDDVYTGFTTPGSGPPESAWRDVSREGDTYRGMVRASAGAIELDFDCRFDVVEEHESRSIRLHGIGVSPRLAFTLDGRLAVRESESGSAVEVDVEVLPSGTVAGLGQRRLGEQVRRLVADFIGT